MQYQEEQDYTKKFDASLWVRLVHYAKPFYRHLLGIMITMLACAGFDVIFPLLTREAIDTFVEAGTTSGLGLFFVKYGAVLLMQVACIFTFCTLSGHVEVGLCRLIREKGFKRLQELPFSFYDKTPVGYMIARMTSDTQRLGDTVGWGLIDLMWAFGYVIMSLVVMFRLNWKLTLVVITVMPVFAVLAVYFQKRILASYRVVRKTNSKITGAFNEGIMGAKTTKTLVREEGNYDEFVQMTHTMRNESVRAAVLSALFMPIVTGLGALASAYALWRGGYNVFTGAIHQLHHPDVRAHRLAGAHLRGSAVLAGRRRARHDPDRDRAGNLRHRRDQGGLRRLLPPQKGKLAGDPRRDRL